MRKDCNNCGMTGLPGIDNCRGCQSPDSKRARKLWVPTGHPLLTINDNLRAELVHLKDMLDGHGICHECGNHTDDKLHDEACNGPLMECKHVGIMADCDACPHNEPHIRDHLCSASGGCKDCVPQEEE